MAQEYDRVDQWVNWGDHTVTIDPIGNKPWIHEGQDGKHLEAAERGRAYDAADVQHLMGLLGKHTTPQKPTFLPTWEDLEKVPNSPRGAAVVAMSTVATCATCVARGSCLSSVNSFATTCCRTWTRV